MVFVMMMIDKEVNAIQNRTIIQDQMNNFDQWAEDATGDWGLETGVACAGAACTGGGGCNAAAAATSNLSMSINADLSDCGSGTAIVNYTYSEPGSNLGTTDCLYYAISTDGEGIYSTTTQIACNDVTGNALGSYEVAASDLTSGFRWRFGCRNMAGADEQWDILDFNITCTDIRPPKINASLNNLSSDIIQGNRVNITANISDAMGLDFCTFVDNQSLPNGQKTYFNKSIKGKSDQCSQNYTIRLTAGNVINFTVIVNDTFNNVNQSRNSSLDQAGLNVIGQIVVVQAIPLGNTCSCPHTSGINMADNCIITADCDEQGAQFYTYGTGTLTIHALIFNYQIPYVLRPVVSCHRLGGCFG